MKSKLNKILTVITAVTFATALTLNIQASLSDPFTGMSDEALTMTTTDDDTTQWDFLIYEEDLHKCGTWTTPEGEELPRWEILCPETGSDECTPEACFP